MCEWVCEGELYDADTFGDYYICRKRGTWQQQQQSNSIL